MVDGLEADRVRAVGGDVDVRAIPADRAAERLLALLAADLRRVRDERQLDELAAAEPAGLEALVVAAVLGVLLEAPQAAELLALAGAGEDRRRSAVRREHDRVRHRIRRGRRHRDEPRDGRECERAEHTGDRGKEASAHSSLFCVISRFPRRRGHARRNGSQCTTNRRRVNTAAGRM